MTRVKFVRKKIGTDMIGKYCSEVVKILSTNWYKYSEEQYQYPPMHKY
jgi:hypothetical protein